MGGRVKAELVSQILDSENTGSSRLGLSDREVLRSRYQAVKTLISNRRDDLWGADSNAFNSIISEVENLHQLVQKPREQVADAKALLDIANTLVASVKSHTSCGLTPSDFVTCLLDKFGEDGGRIFNAATPQIRWSEIGMVASPIFTKVQGCRTMLGPMNKELKKQRKAAVRRRRPRWPVDSPKELNDYGGHTDTDKNMATMFEIMKRKKKVKLECLVLNRRSFAQTVENLFAFSFLVRDGRACVAVDGNGSHLVMPKNAPAISRVLAKEVVYSYFVFRFDFKDWQLMRDMVPVGDELMPHRDWHPLEITSVKDAEPDTLEAVLRACKQEPH